jgi:two-component system sensor histidine kinase YesM
MDSQVNRKPTSLKERFWQRWQDGAPQNVQTTLTVYFVTVIVIPLFLLGFITYLISSRTITRRVQTYVNQIIIQVKENFEYYFRDLQSLSYVISVNPEVLNVLREQNSLNGWQEIGYQNKIKSFLAGLTSSRLEVRGIYLVARNRKQVYSSGSPVLLEYLEKQLWFSQAIRSGAAITVTPVHSENYAGISMGTRGTVITYCQRIVDFDSQRELGWILVDLDYGFVTKILQNVHLWDQGEISILDSKGRMVYGDAGKAQQYQNEIYNSLYLKESGSYLLHFSGKKELIVFQTVSLCEWKVIFAIPYLALQRENLLIRNLTMLFALVLLGIAIYLTVLFTRKITEPLNLLRTSMHEVEEGNLEVRIKIRSMNEFNDLATSFNHMVAQIGGLMDAIYAAEKKKRLAELNVLQAQINPHFLYNTLDSLRWLAKIRNVEEISEVISALENLLRSSIGKTDPWITIGQELENVRNYIEIQLFRYGNSFTVEYTINPQVTECFIPRLILQPIVENAIYHGIEGLSQGEILIVIDAADKNISIAVSDNGCGIDADLARAILEGRTGGGQRFSGLGIKNVDERLKLYFGPQFGVKIAKNEPQGAKISILIPRIGQHEKRKLLKWSKS